MKELKEIKELNKIIERQNEIDTEKEKNGAFYFKIKNNKDNKDIKELYKEWEQNERDIGDAQSTLTIEKNIILNNIDYLINKDFIANVIPMLHTYDNKRIGEKTSEKIRNEVKEYFAKNYNNLNVYFNFYKPYDFASNYDIKLTIYVKGYTYEITKLEYQLYYNVQDAHVTYNFYGESKYNYNYIDNPNKEAQKIYKNTLKAKNELEKQINEINEKIKEYNNANSYNHLNDNYINQIIR